MYEFIKGPVCDISSEYIVIETNGLGYKVITPKNDASKLLSLGSPSTLYVEPIIREDMHTLYGFSDKKERDFFRLLIQVNGIGPKLAISILSSATATDIVQSIQNKNTKHLSSFPGIGKKLAERLILELSEKISPMYAKMTASSPCNMHIALGAEQALQTLGFSSMEAAKIIRAVQEKYPNIDSIENMVQHALIVKRTVKI